MRNLLLGLLVMVALSGCQSRDVPAKGNLKMMVFDNEHLFFSPEEFDGEVDVNATQTIRIADGRMLLKKVTLPEYLRDVKARVNIKLSSGGDRWDKSGSCFVIPPSSAIDFLKIHNGEASLPEIPESLETLAGVVSGEGYSPVVELMRFMTPFGVGAYSDKMEMRRPVYVPFWEKQVEWEQDITDRLSLLEGEIWIGVWIDTWTKEGYKVSVSLDFEESPFACAAKTATGVKSLVNTVYYIDGQTHADIFSRKDIEVEAEIPANAKNVRLEYITTGHGGHSGGDEFVKKANIVKVDGVEVLNFIPWRDDCASFRRFNPGTGVWLVKDTAEYIDEKTWTYKTKVIEERLASSDLSRSNWCPGSDVQPEEVSLNVKPGMHTFTFSIPQAQAIDGEKMNHWLISAYLVWDK
ncbi:N-glycanase [Marinilabiliaceae bacterium JC017]|nr:N-glycanase [Marinilabiliaceae bacterium JC017]